MVGVGDNSQLAIGLSQQPLGAVLRQCDSRFDLFFSFSFTNYFLVLVSF